jgi:hypothetical protein
VLLGEREKLRRKLAYYIAVERHLIALHKLLRTEISSSGSAESVWRRHLFDNKDANAAIVIIRASPSHFSSEHICCVLRIRCLLGNLEQFAAHNLIM